MYANILPTWKVYFAKLYSYVEGEKKLSCMEFLWYGIVIIVLFCTDMVWFSMSLVWYSAFWHGVAWYGVVWWGMLWHGIVLCDIYMV
jgi:hypothetical protein